MRTLFSVAALAATATLAFGAGSASAAKNCGTTVINDWYVDGTIDHQYPAQCYRLALSRVTDQMRIYSDLPEQLDRGLRAALQRQAGHGMLGTSKTITHGSSRSSAQHKPTGPIQRVLGELGPARADSIPVPLVILAGLALILIAAGAVSVILRRVNGRKNTP
jgi:hypothetical protein